MIPRCMPVEIPSIWGLIMAEHDLDDDDFLYDDADYYYWAANQYKKWKDKENVGFSAVGEYWDWIQEGEEHGYISEVESPFKQIDE